MTADVCYLEVCIDNTESAVNAVNGGCDRLEVCSSLAVGGLTPSVGFASFLIEKYPHIPMYCMIRPRSDTFVYSADEMEMNVEDVEWLKKAGTAGYVFGALTSSGDLDRSACLQIIEAASPLPVTLHRAIDVSRDWRKTLEEAIEIGFKAVLTSGHELTAIEGQDVIREMKEIAGDRIDIMAGSGVKSSNVAQLREYTKCKWFHASASVVKERQNNSVPMGRNGNQPLRITSVDEVRLLKTNMEH